MDAYTSTIVLYEWVAKMPPEHDEVLSRFLDLPIEVVIKARKKRQKTEGV